MFIDSKIQFVNHLYEIKTYKFFTYLNNKNQILPDLGWKIHISATNDNISLIFDKVFKFLINSKLTFKFVKDKTTYFKFLTDEVKLENAFKFITIYSENREQAILTLEKLHKILKDFNSPLIVGDRRYKDSGCLFYRYGYYVNKNKYDNRRVFSLTSGIQDLQEVNTNLNKLLLNQKYEIISLLKEKTTSSVYLLKNINDHKFYIAKQARNYTFYDENNSSINLRENEVNNSLKLLSEFVPKFIESFEIEGDCFFVWEYLNIIPLNIWKLRETINLEQTLSNEFISELKIITLEFIKMHKEFQNKKFNINDYNLSNFGYDRKLKKLYLIDLEHSYFEGSNKKINVCNSICKLDKKPLNQNNISLALLISDLLLDYKKFLSFDPDLENYLRYLNFIISKTNIDFGFFEIIDYLSNVKIFDFEKSIQLLKSQKLNDNIYFEQKNKEKVINFLKIKSSQKHNLEERLESKTFVDIRFLLSLSFKRFSFWIRKFKYVKLNLIDAEIDLDLTDRYQKIINILFSNKKTNSEILFKEFDEFISEKVVKTKENTYGVKVKNYYSPYLNYGLAFLIALLLFSKVKTRSNKFDEWILKFTDSLTNKFTFKQSFLNGNIGNIVIIHNVGKLFKNKIFIKNAIDQTYNKLGHEIWTQPYLVFLYI
ncbi:class III lanthionine synthetase LanKC N-terminal domain-containing protein [Mycoplasmopsis gallinacea]|uniref:RamC N-terminal domain-containing protein n=1 Tax=Mycoplasmopsis gallinacea TaxID=29556 RepID=A0A449A2S9_9BACT|nr:hypothetical protein [Mycoplasmopsis gallinacea]VEU58512.1 Uncharacterised protein [Mycoplasmopsis gallinacea]